MFSKASLTRLVCAVLLISTLSSGYVSADFAKCYHVVIPTTNDGFLNTLFDYVDSNDIVLTLNNGTDNTLEFNVAVTKTEVGLVFTGQSLAVFDFFDKLILGGGEVTEVDYDGYCRAAILDGRLNKYDLGALAYVYPDSDGYSVWELNLSDMQGYQQFAVTNADVVAAIATANETGLNQQIGATTERGTTLWALVGGQCQLNHFEQDGKINAFAFDCAL